VRGQQQFNILQQYIFTDPSSFSPLHQQAAHHSAFHW